MEILNKWEKNPEDFLEPIVIRDKTWLYQYDPEDIQSHSKQLLPKGGKYPVKANQSGGKFMVTVF